MCSKFRSKSKQILEVWTCAFSNLRKFTIYLNTNPALLEGWRMEVILPNDIVTKGGFNSAFASSALQPGGDEAHPRGADQPRPGGDRVLLRDEQGEQAQGRGHLQVDTVPAGRGHGGPRQVHTPHAQARADHRHSREADGAEIVIDSSVSRFICERDDVESDSCR